MRHLLLGGFVATLASFPFLPAQAPAVAPQPAMLATKDYLFVLRGDVLWQFDVHSLQVRNRFEFPGEARDLPAAIAAIPVEPPPPPPPPPAAATADAVGAGLTAALDWLASHQDEDGRWDADNFMKHDTDLTPAGGAGNAVHDVGVTGLAVLAMLAEGSTMRQGRYKQNIKRAVQWLRDQQQENGLFGVNASHDFVYDHAIATYALCETYGLSNYKLLQPIAQKGLNYLESHRNPYAVWRYQPRDNDNDTSVTTWAVLAMCSGKSFGLEVNEQALKLAAVWYDQVTSPDGRAGYSKAGEPSSRKPGDHVARFPVEKGEAMTAAALFARLVLGQEPQGQRLVAAAERLLAKPPVWGKGTVDAVYWTFGTLAMYQMGGKYWAGWRGIGGTLLQNQRQDGGARGSWDPVGVWDEDGGRVFVTALNALSLAVVKRQAMLVK